MVDPSNFDGLVCNVEKSSANQPNETPLTLGIRAESGSAHASRTMMLDELTLLLDTVEDDASQERYQDAIVEQNCLGKRSERTRILSFRHLVDLYALEPNTIVFRALRYFW